MRFLPKGPQQFRNTSLGLKGIVKNGITMIDIGFVDFGVVFDSLQNLNVGGEPIKIIGIDMEPFCVAKTLVMLEMMMCSTSPRNLVEIWLSSLWSEETYTAFSEAVDMVLQQHDLDDRVIPILSLWLAQPKPTAQSSIAFQMKRFLDQTDIAFCTRACNLAEERDRVEYLRYHVTKAFYEDSSTVVGSPVMSVEDASLGIRQICENSFEGVPINIIHNRSHSGLTTKDGSSLLERTQQYLLRRTNDTLVKNGVIRFTPKVGEITTHNKKLLNELASMDPYLISWSNVVDYIHPHQFHKIARSISGENTMHFFHSMNWPTRVYGTDILDIATEARLGIFASGLFFMDQSRLAVEGLTPRGIYHFRNICTPILARDHINSFLRYFFEGQ